MSAEATIHLIPYGGDPLRHLAELLLDRHRDRLPDLSRPVVLFPHVAAVPRFRQILREVAAQRGHEALLPPYAGTLAAWACRYADEHKRRLNATAREILLLDLLNGLPEWRDQYSAWPLIDSLLALFDELTLEQCRLPDDAQAFLRSIAKSCRTELDEFSPFGEEARLVHALWGAWRERLAKNHLQDQTLQISGGLARSLKQLPVDAHIYLAGFADFSRTELEWLQALRAQNRATLLLHGTAGGDERENSIEHVLKELGAAPVAPPAPDTYAQFLQRAFASADGPLRERARRQAAESPASPARGRLTIHEAADAESEARAVDLQVRRWLTQGHRDIGIVTNDRRLARRVRALLERANIGLQDAGGWALSTTSAATAAARWLECLEQRFAYEPLLDLLKSPFLRLGFGRAELDRLVPPLEQVVVRGRNVVSGLDNYRYALERARSDLATHFGADVAEALALLLNRLEAAAAPLAPLLHGRPRPAPDFLAAFMKSLEQLGLSAGYESDAAGRELLAALEEMRGAAARSGLRLPWAGFHAWLRRNMERRRFHPPLKGRGVELMSFAESHLYRGEALIIAGALREHLPGSLGAPPYFNDGVRAELGLPSLARRYALLFHDFRRLLEAAPRVTISLHGESEGERLAPSPWVERLRAFHDLAYGESLRDPELEWLVQQPGTLIVNRETPLPAPMPPPAARLPAALLPPAFTATDHERLIDCPYQFFCAGGLKLAPEKDVREEIEKKDFGIYVHRILQAFHAGAPGLPGPWRGPLDDEALPAAEKLLREISEAVFADDLRRRFIARGWFYRWEECIPAYLEWERKRSARWQAQATELKKERQWREGATRVTIKGRIDRLDRGADGLRIVDYKTGTVPSLKEVLGGEKIQLPFYALLLEEENIARALFLSVQDGEVTEKIALDGEALAPLRAAVRERLTVLVRRLQAEAPLPAWGDADTCAVCDMEGLCRREMWTGPSTSEKCA